MNLDDELARYVVAEWRRLVREYLAAWGLEKELSAWPDPTHPAVRLAASITDEAALAMRDHREFALAVGDRLTRRHVDRFRILASVRSEGMRYVPVTVDRVVRSTDLAFLVEVDGDEIWIPKSLVEDGPDLDVDGSEEVEMYVAEWFARREDIA